MKEVTAQDILDLARAYATLTECSQNKNGDYRYSILESLFKASETYQKQL